MKGKDEYASNEKTFLPGEWRVRSEQYKIGGHEFRNFLKAAKETYKTREAKKTIIQGQNAESSPWRVRKLWTRNKKKAIPMWRRRGATLKAARRQRDGSICAIEVG